MKHAVIRRAAPILFGLGLLASLSVAGASARTATNSASTTAVTQSSSQQTVRQVQAVGSIRSLSDLATAQSASGPSAKPRSSVGNLPDAIQAPYHRGSAAPAASGAGRGAAVTAPLAVPVVTPLAVSGTDAVKSFAGLNAYEERRVAAAGNQFTFTPPDQGMCAGNGFVMESVNGAIRIYDTTGHALTPPIGSNAFYGYPPAINRTTGEFGPELTDPSCYFDPQYSRWFHVTLTLDTNPSTGALTLGNHLDIAVSATNNPLAGWIIYRIAVTDDGTQGTPFHFSCPCIGDYPHIGADANGFYITTNEYPWGNGPGVFGNNWNGAQIYAMSKFSLAQNSASFSAVQFSGLALADGTPAFTLWPSEVPGTGYDTQLNGSEWFSQSKAAFQETKNPAGMSNSIAVWRLSNTASLDAVTPALTLESNSLSSEVYGVPPPSEQKVGPVPLRDCLLLQCLAGVGPSRGEVEGPLDSNDSRMQSAWLAGGTLFTALDTIVEVGGRYQAGVAYFIVNTASAITGTSIANQGYAAVAGNITYPSVATLPDGSGAMALTLVGVNNFPSAAYIRVNATGLNGGVHVASGGKGPQDDFCEYVFENCAGTPIPIARPRWGDYGAAAIVGTQVWIASEYIGQSCTIDTFQADPTCGLTRAPLANWGTRITQVN